MSVQEPAFQDAPAPYRLGPSDVLKIKLTAWRPSQNEVFEWKEISGEYTVGASGAISIPLVGDVDVNGITPAQTGQRVRERLQQRLGLAQPPDAAVEVMRYRPFYILGDVANPGEYAYRPDFNVIKAISLAGGTQAGGAGDRAGARRDRINGVGQLGELMSERTALRVQRARLEATLDGRKSMETPAATAEPASAILRAAIDHESRLFQVNRETIQTRRAQLIQTKEILKARLAFLEQQISKNVELAAASQKEQGAVSENFSRGITNQQRLMATRRQTIETEIQTLRLRAEGAAVEKDIQQIDVEISTMEASARKDALTDLSAVTVRLERVNHQIATAATFAFGAAPAFASDRAIKADIEILRGPADAVTSISAGETTPVLPGDTIKVTLPRVQLEDEEVAGEAGKFVTQRK